MDNTLIHTQIPLKFISFPPVPIPKNSSASRNSCTYGEHVSIVKVVELIGASPDGWKEAAENALEEAAKTVRNIKALHLKRCTAKVVNNKIVEYRAVVKVAFVVEREKIA